MDLETLSKTEAEGEKPEALEIEKIESEQPEVEAKAVEDGEAEIEEVQEEKPKKLGGYKLKLERERQKNQELAQRLAELESKVAVRNDAPTEEPQPEKFENNTDYVKALAKWTVEQERKEAQALQAKEEAKRQAQTVAASHEERLKEFKKQTPDFDKVVEGFIEENDDFELSPHLSKLIMKRPVGPAALYELAKNPELLNEINSLDAEDAAIEFGKLEAKLTKPKTEVKKSTAPRPVAPISGTKTEVKKSIYDESLSFQEYEKLRMEQIRARRA